MSGPADSLVFRLALEPGVAEYEQGFAAGWDAGRADLAQQLAERADCLDATWRPIPRPSWEQRVAERVAEMEAAMARQSDCLRGGGAPDRGTAA